MESCDWIGENAIIFFGLIVDKNIIVGPGFVVTKSIMAGDVAVGNFALVVKKIYNEI